MPKTDSVISPFTRLPHGNTLCPQGPDPLETRSHTAQAGLELLILPPPPKYICQHNLCCAGGQTQGSVDKRHRTSEPHPSFPILSLQGSKPPNLLSTFLSSLNSRQQSTQPLSSAPHTVVSLYSFILKAVSYVVQAGPRLIM